MIIITATLLYYPESIFKRANMDSATQKEINSNVLGLATRPFLIYTEAAEGKVKKKSSSGWCSIFSTLSKEYGIFI